MSVREPISVDYQCVTKSRSAWKQSLIVRCIFRVEFNVKTDEPPRAGWTELAGRIWPAGRTLPTPGLTLWWTQVISSLKPKFHYADFSVTSATNPWCLLWFVCDIADFLVSCHRRRWFPRHKWAGCWVVTGIFPTTSTCRDVLKPRNIPLTSPWRDPRRRHPHDKSPTSSKLPHDTCRGEVLGKSA